VYEVEDVTVKTEVEVASPSSYQLTNAPLTRLKLKRQLDDQLADPYRQHRRALNTTEALPSFPSVSKRMAVKRRLDISAPTSTLLTPL
jgi:hypothetical protein